MPFPDPVATPVLAITPWADPVIDSLGHDPRSLYVETFWLGILGPSATWLLRRIAAELDRHPAGFAMPLHDTAVSLGLGARNGKHSPFLRSLARCCQFGLAAQSGSDGLAVRRHVPPLTRAQVAKLPDDLRTAHQEWTERDLRHPHARDQQRRARKLALSMGELGETADCIERRLHRWRFHPAVAHEAARWAHAQLHSATAPVAPVAPLVPVVLAPTGDAA